MNPSIMNVPRNNAAKAFLRIIEKSLISDVTLDVIAAGKYFRVALIRHTKHFGNYVCASTSCFKTYNDAYHFMCKM